MKTYASILLLLLATQAHAQTILEYCGPNCIYCEQMKPTVAALQREGLRISTVDCGTQLGQQAAKDAGVTGYPTFIAYDANKNRVGRIVGATSASNLRSLWGKATRDPRLPAEPLASESFVRPDNSTTGRIGFVKVAETSEGGKLFDDILASSGKESYYRQKYAGKPAVMVHEASHGATEAAIKQLGGGNAFAFYLGGGQAYVLPDPRTTISQVAARVPEQYRDKDMYQNYLVKLASNPTLVIADEWSASINTWEALQEQGLPTADDEKMTTYFTAYVDSMAAAIEQNEPQYPVDRLHEFVGFQKQRIANLRGRLDQRFPNRTGAIIPRATARSNGSAGGVPPAPVQPPRPDNPQQPTTQPPNQPQPPVDPGPGDSACNCQQQINALIVRINQLEGETQSHHNEIANLWQSTKTNGDNITNIDNRVAKIDQWVSSTEQNGPPLNYDLIADETAKRFQPLNIRINDPRGAAYSTDYKQWQIRTLDQPAQYVKLPFQPVTQN